MERRCLVRAADRGGAVFSAERGAGMQVLDLGNNGMTETSAAALAAYLEQHGDLRDLNLYMNAIGSDGLEKVL